MRRVHQRVTIIDVIVGQRAVFLELQAVAIEQEMPHTQRETLPFTNLILHGGDGVRHRYFQEKLGDPRLPDYHTHHHAGRRPVAALQIVAA